MNINYGMPNHDSNVRSANPLSLRKQVIHKRNSSNNDVDIGSAKLSLGVPSVHRLPICVRAFTDVWTKAQQINMYTLKLAIKACTKLRLRHHLNRKPGKSKTSNEKAYFEQNQRRLRLTVGV